MDKQQIKDMVKNVTMQELGLSDSRYDENETFNVLGADSLDEIGLVMRFEEETGHDFPDEEIEKITTPKEAETYLCEKLLN
jgi:acyl carrier protein